jgi:CNT family concentrative nucleoside transporter
MVPETDSLTSGELTAPEQASGTMDAITKGTIQGLELLLNIIAMIIVLVALVHLVNLFIGLFPQINNEAITLQRIFGWIMSYALCGFANPGSLGIMIGGLGGIAPERREDIVSLGFRSIVAGTIATCMTGAVVGILNG